MFDHRIALDPARSAVVEACAGSGKTWLLVSRMIGLLLAGAVPSELLAITFTRKAAQEMNDRLHQWLTELALGDDDTVRDFLRQRGEPEAELAALLPRARGLLETVLTAQPGPTITTFHGWFLDTIRRAPLEAGLPWGAPLLEAESRLAGEVWRRLASRWAGEPDSPHGQALAALLHTPGEHGLEKLMRRMLARRAEWWAYAAGRADPVDHALTELRAGFSTDPAADPVTALLADEPTQARLRRVALALEKGTATEQGKSQKLSDALKHGDCDALSGQILKQNGERRASRATKALLTALGTEADTYLRDYEQLEAAFESLAVARAEQAIWHLNRHGLLLGHAYIDAFQQAKAQRGVLDFNDAEWQARRLLTDPEFAPQLAMKLDARYRHVLLDEFQDTNPLQWQAISNWLAEVRAADSGTTVFLVGDPKQAIYRFRRGEARVFGVARDFLSQQFGASVQDNPVTRRLAPTVVAAVNATFADVDGYAVHAALPGDSRPGAVWRLEIAAPERGPAPAGAGLRDPLTTPRAEADDRLVHEEARRFAATLRERILGRWRIGDRAARPGDVYALVKKRTHLAIYERELDAAGIPYLSSRRGGLLDALEVADLGALLETLALPHADLSLAHVLKSPLFACSDADLLALFGHGSSGWTRLGALVDASPELARAARLLPRWHAEVGTLPVHDLLDRIYFDADVEARYRAAVPPAMRPQVAANLTALLELALTQDAGRYPTLAGFIRELAALAEHADEAPDEGIVASGEDAVRLLTIHGAKGLESPIVWLLCGSERGPSEAYDVLAPWPPEADAPEHFSLVGTQDQRQGARSRWFDAEVALAENEQHNLLYVAMTRAEQALIVSGDPGHPWLVQLAAAGVGDTPADLPLADAVAPSAAPSPAPLLSAPATGSRRVSDATAATQLGEFFHACLEAHAPPGRALDLDALALSLGLDTATRDAVHANASALLTSPALARFFDPAHYRQAHNEYELWLADARTIRLDRLVEFDDALWVLDYKTGDADRVASDAELIERHADQLGSYVMALATLHPGKLVRAAVLTADARLVELPA